MNEYFLHHAIQTAKQQLKRAGILDSEFDNKDLTNLAIQLAIVDELQTISGDIRDVEAKLTALPNTIR